jgi:hypothetical protein
MEIIEKILEDVDEYLIEKQKKEGVERPISLAYDFDEQEYFLHLGKYFYGWLRFNHIEEKWVHYGCEGYIRFDPVENICHPKYNFLCIMKENPDVPESYFVDFNKEAERRLSEGYSIKMHKTLCYSLRITFCYYFMCIKKNKTKDLPEEMILKILSFITIWGLYLSGK